MSTYVQVPFSWLFVICEPSPPVIVSARISTLPGPGFEMSLTTMAATPAEIVSPWPLSVFVTVSCTVTSTALLIRPPSSITSTGERPERIVTSVVPHGIVWVSVWPLPPVCESPAARARRLTSASRWTLTVLLLVSTKRARRVVPGCARSVRFTSGSRGPAVTRAWFVVLVLPLTVPTRVVELLPCDSTKPKSPVARAKP